MMKEIALAVETDRLASVPESRVDGKDTFLTHRGRQQELLEILPEDLDRLDIRFLLGLFEYLVGDGRVEQGRPIEIGKKLWLKVF